MIPTIEQLDAAWFADVVGTPDDATVSVVPVGTGQVANCYRVTVRNETSEQSFIAKVPSTDTTSRATAAGQRLYLRETSFYRQLAPRIATRTPFCYFVDRDEDDNFLLLLEDVGPVRDVDQFAGLTTDQAREGLRQLAHLHAATLGDVELHGAVWLDGYAKTVAPVVREILPALFGQFLERYADVLDEETRTVVSTLREHLGLFAGYVTPHPAVQHGDFRTDNLLFEAKDGQVPLVVVDWQTVAVGSPLLDVAYFVVTSLSPEDCAREDELLLDFYLDFLEGLGGRLDRAVARREFARYTLQPIVMLVAASVIVARTERGDRMFLSMIRRAVTATVRWRGIEELVTRATA
jgi:thiamine kinase-like enzyme